MGELHALPNWIVVVHLKNLQQFLRNLTKRNVMLNISYLNRHCRSQNVQTLVLKEGARKWVKFRLQAHQFIHVQTLSFTDSTCYFYFSIRPIRKLTSNSIE